MGRPPLDHVARETKLFIKVSEEEAEELEKLAIYLEIPKSVLVRNLTLSALEDAQIFKKLGLLKLAKGLRKTSEAIDKFGEMKTNINSKPN